MLVASAIALALFQLTLIHHDQSPTLSSAVPLPSARLQDFVSKSLVTKKKSKTSQKVNAAKLPRPPVYYMVFSTSCTPQQNWESYVFFFHAMKVLQPGTVVCTT
jgi:hypothetical protein